jgi:hypothetical protein
MLLFHSAHHHAEMAGFNHHAHSLWLNDFPDGLGNLRGQTQIAGICGLAGNPAGPGGATLSGSVTTVCRFAYGIYCDFKRSSVMNQVQEYWRDKVANMLQWGAALFVLFAGWALQSHEKFRLRGASWSSGRDELLAAIGLLTVTIPYSILFPVAVGVVYKRFLGSGTDATVLPRRVALAFAVVLSFCTLAVAVLMCAF